MVISLGCAVEVATGCDQPLPAASVYIV